MFPISNIEKRNMTGSPRRKKQYKLSPKHNNDIKKYKKSRSRERKKAEKKSPEKK
jgi:hypothetical protein